MNRLNTKGWILLAALIVVGLTVLIAVIGPKPESREEVPVAESDWVYIDATGTVVLKCQPSATRCQARIRFDEAEPGTELWRLREEGTFGSSWELLEITLTAGFRGQAGFEKRPDEKTLVIYGDRAGEVSYQLLAPVMEDTETPKLSML